MRTAGHTVVELLIVLALLALLVGTAIATSARSDSILRVERTGTAIAEAIRYGRAEAMRTSSLRLVRIEASGLARVAEPTLTGGTVTSETPLIDPIAKHDYEFTVGSLPGARGVEVTSALPAFGYVGLGARQPAVLFDATGAPIWMQAGTVYPLDSGEIDVGFGASSVRIELDAHGRVTTS